MPVFGTQIDSGAFESSRWPMHHTCRAEALNGVCSGRGLALAAENNQAGSN